MFETHISFSFFIVIFTLDKLTVKFTDYLYLFSRISWSLFFSQYKKKYQCLSIFTEEIVYSSERFAFMNF